MTQVYQPNAYRARRARRARRYGAYTLPAFTNDLLALAGTVALIAALVLLLGAWVSDHNAQAPFLPYPADASAAPAAPSYALVMVYNAPDAWRELVVVSGLSFAACDKQQRAVWAMPAHEVTTGAGDTLPSVDAYCVDDTQIPSDVAR